MAKEKKLITLADIQAQRAKMEADIAALQQQENEVKERTVKLVADVLDKALTDIRAVAGDDVNMAQVAVFAKAHSKGEFTSLTSTTGTAMGDRGKRLTDEQRKALRQDLLNRALNLKAGKQAEQQSQIMERHGVSTSTADKYKPSEAEIAAGKLIDGEAPAAPTA